MYEYAKNMLVRLRIDKDWATSGARGASGACKERKPPYGDLILDIYVEEGCGWVGRAIIQSTNLPTNLSRNHSMHPPPPTLPMTESTHFSKLQAQCTVCDLPAKQMTSLATTVEIFLSHS